MEEKLMKHEIEKMKHEVHVRETARKAGLFFPIQEAESMRLSFG